MSDPKAVTKKYPSLIAPDKSRNAVQPDWRAASKIVKSANFALCHMRKVVFQKTSDLLTAPYNSGSGVESKQWYFAFRSGEASTTAGALYLRAHAVSIPSSSWAAGNGRWRLTIDDGSTVTSSDYVYNPMVWDDNGVQDLALHTVTMPIDPDTVYQCYFEVKENLVVVSGCAYELHAPFVDVTDTVASDWTKFGDGVGITTAQATELAANPHTIWKHNGAQLFSLAADSHVADVFHQWATNSATYVNALDASASTTVGAKTAGLNLDVQYMNPAHTTDVNCVVWAFASSTNDDGDIALVDSGGTLCTLSNFVAAGEWKSASFVLDGSAALNKVDIHFRGVTSTMLVYGISAYVYDA